MCAHSSVCVFLRVSAYTYVILVANSSFVAIPAYVCSVCECMCVKFIINTFAHRAPLKTHEKKVV